MSVLVSDVLVVAAESRPAGGSVVTLATSDDAVRIELDVERELARTLVARIIGKPVRLGDPHASLAPEIEGALAAIVCSVARRAHGSNELLRPIGPGGVRVAPGERRIEIHATVLIGPDAYGVRATLQTRRLFSPVAMHSTADLAALGDIPISLPVVAAVSGAPAIELYGIALGDVWMPGDGWTAHRATSVSLSGDVLLMAPSSERGIRARLGDRGEIVVVGVEASAHDVEANAMSGQPDDDPWKSPTGDSTATSEVVLGAPLVVRVELGAVTLAAREWAALRTGDVIALGRRVSEPVVLRVAGVEVARGELVDIEGELGVRIRERVEAT